MYYVFGVLMACACLNACSDADRIHASSMKTAHKSVAFIKEHLKPAQRIEFEVAYWAIRKQLKDDSEFLKTIDKKSSADIIELAKANFAKDKAAGSTEAAEYGNWEQMIARQIEQRNQQDQSAVDPHDKKGYPRVDYKMHAM